MDEAIADPGFMEMLYSLAKDSCELESLVNDLETSFEALYPPPHCSKQYSSINLKYTNVIARIDSAIMQSQRILSKIDDTTVSPIISAYSSGFTSSAHSRSPSTPQFNSNTHDKMFNVFLSNDLPQVSMPYPPLCGSVPLPHDTPVPVGSFVASKLNNEWTLCYVLAMEENGYRICDAESDSTSSITVDRNNVIPLPTSLPDRNIKAVEFPPKNARTFAVSREQWLVDICFL
ncbi:uncharacterized protein GO595_003194 [Histomonas meleagridis]|uniref:uncharacterized protein n=1 Tax=Histomonas meleagridis TaxID=135588 RepID=UPI00355AC5B5|nr:hypothetical protein GO595_003194 [Histomonas meleagridis]